MDAVNDSRLAAFHEAIGDVPVIEDAATIRMKSRDFFWFSPILKPQLDDKRADLVVRPRDKADIIKVAAEVAKARLPVTIRGGGTGNYGQAVPLDGGVVMDLGSLDKVIWAKPGAGRFEAGLTMLDLDRALKANPTASGRWELRYHPSTRKQATIGWFIAGGAAGCGSCSWGQISDPGAVLAVEVVTVEETPRVIELRGPDALKVLHAYGVNGIITEVEIPLAPWQPWAERILAFPTFADATRFGMALAASEAIAAKEVGIFDRRIPPMLKRLAQLVPATKALAIVMVSEPQAPALADLATAHNGDVVFARDAEATDAAAFEGVGDIAPLYEYTWNHTTLHALRVEPTITYLQVRFPAGGELELAEAIENRFGDEVLLHLEVQRRFGRVFVSSLPLLRYASPERLDAVIAEIEALGGAVSNPHTYLLNNAGWKRTDAPQAAFKAEADPYGLMNPGKLLV